MSIRYKNVASDTQMKAVTGYSFVEFEALLPFFEKAHQMRKGQLADRLNNVRPFSMETYQDYLFFVLYKIKTNAGYMNLGLVFGFSHTTAENLFKEGIRLLELALKLSSAQPARQAEELSLDPEQTYGLDATGFVDERPQDADEQRITYSWKHRCPEQKATIMADLQHAIIAYVGRICTGSRHDKTMFEHEFKHHKQALHGIRFFADLAYLKVKKFCKEARFVLPIKKPKGGELKQDQKRYNRMLSPLRVRVEHAIRGIKRYDIFSERIRLKDLDVFDRLVGIGAGLWNFKCKHRLGILMPLHALQTA